jgi:phosphinothricin acetyltransferase
MILVRDVKHEDTGVLLKIYSYYVEYTAISFESEIPSLAEFESRIRSITEHYPYLVIEEDGVVQGYAYAHLFVGRDAYSYSAEMTIYLDAKSRGRGLGKILYGELESRLKAMGITNLYACIGVTEKEDEYLTNNSRDFHSHIGYKTVGVFNKCGRKFGRWYDMIWMEKYIGEHTHDPAPVNWYNSAD